MKTISRVGERWQVRRVDWLLALTLPDRILGPWDSRRERATKISSGTAQVATWLNDFLSLLLACVRANRAFGGAIRTISSRLADGRHRCDQVSARQH